MQARQVIYVLHKSCPTGIYIKHETKERSAGGRVLCLPYLPYLGMIYVICVILLMVWHSYKSPHEGTGMQYIVPGGPLM